RLLVDTGMRPAAARRYQRKPAVPAGASDLGTQRPICSPGGTARAEPLKVGLAANFGGGGAGSRADWAAARPRSRLSGGIRRRSAKRGDRRASAGSAPRQDRLMGAAARLRPGRMAGRSPSGRVLLVTKTLTGALTEAVTGAATEPAAAMPRALIGLTAFVAILDCVIVGPLAGHGSLQLLDIGDYPAGPHPPPATSAFGFPPGVTSRAPVNVAIYWIFGHLHWSALHLTPLAAVAPLACIGFSRLFSGRPVAAAAATLLFTVNPFIYERMANGQMYVVMGYSLLPLLLALVFRPLASLAATSCAGGIILATSVACSVHYLFIAGAMLIAGIAVSVPLRARKAALAAIGTSLCGAMLSLYWLIPAASDSHYAASHVTKADLPVFQTASDGLWGLGANILGLYGFWRPGPPLVKNELSGWTILLFAIFAIAAF